MSLQIPLQDVQSATNNFAVENIIGRGGFGRVYKGQLLIDGQHIDIAARRLDPAYGQGSKEFWTEISILNRLKHSNLVCIVGFCDEKDEKIIINKYEARGSLDKYLSDPTLTWLQRLQICYHVAVALSYIHYDAGRDFSVIHRNIKSSKILLSDDWEPKLAGYGLSITNTTGLRNFALADNACGTLGYVDPAYAETGLVSHKSDMYSFGVVLFEVLCGRKAIIIQVNGNRRFLAKLAKSHYESGTLDEIIHPDLQEQIDPQSLSIFSKTAYACLNEEQSKRPDADQIVKRLEKALEFQLKQQTPEHSIVDLEVEDALLKERSIFNLEVEDALLKERTIIDLEIEDAFFKGKYTEHLKIPLRDIRLATDDFSERYLIGKGGFSMVYKCKLPNTENDVVIKRLLTTANSQGEQSFLEEIEMLSACKHPNIISLLGLCYEGGNMILVLEYACKGSLDDLLEGNDCLDGFTWDQRIQICLDVAHGLKYLHTGMDDKNVIIHRDIKSANILLDQNGRAKIADFGLSKLRSSYEKGNTLNTNSSKPKSCDTPLHASSHEELHDIVPSYSNIDSNLPPSDANCDPGYGNNDSNLPPSDAKNDPSYDNIDSNLPPSDANCDPGYGNIDSNLLPSDTKNDPSYNIDNNLPPSDANRDPGYGNIDSNLPPSDANRDLSYGNVDSNLPPSDANRDPSYGNVDSNLPPSDANRDPGYDNVDSNLPPNDANRDPGYDNIDSNLPPSGANHDPSYGNIDSNLPLSDTNRNIDSDLPSGANRDPSYHNISDLPSGADRDLSYANVDSNLSPSDANRDPSYNNVDSNLHPSDANHDPGYDNVDSNLPPSDANRVPGYENVDSNLPPSDANRDPSYGNVDSNLPPSDLSYENIDGRLPPGNGNIDSSLPSGYDNLDPSNFPTGSGIYFRNLSNSNDSFCGPQNFSTAHSLRYSPGPNISSYGYDFFSGVPGLSNEHVRQNISNYGPSYDFLGVPGLSYEHVRPNISNYGPSNYFYGAPGLSDQAHQNVTRWGYGDSAPGISLVGRPRKSIGGTLVYLDPEYRKTGRLKKEIDIYSFGVVLFEVLCGKLAYDAIYTADSKTGIASIARKSFKQGNLIEMIDPKLNNIVDENISVRNKEFYKKSLDTFVEIAHQCVTETQTKRPEIEVVIKELEKALHLLTSGEFAEYQIPLEEIELATKNFHEENFIGRGTSEDHFYKGLLMRSGKPINVVARRFSGNEIQFWKEISMLSSPKHKKFKNVVSLVGFCLEKSEKIVIYDIEVHGTLDQLLSDPTNFTWPRRLKVCLGVADALRKIHYDVIHCDINSSKIFVDKDWEAKVFGFELSTEYPESWMHRLLFSQYFDTSSGCKDPDYVGTKRLMPKYDVYSFGVMLFEILCWRKAIMTGDGGVSPSLVKMAMDHYKEKNIDKIIDPDLRKQMDEQSLKTFSEVAYHCLDERVKRPTMDKVFRELEDASVLQGEHDFLVHSKLKDEALPSNNLKEKMVIPLEKILVATDNFNLDKAVGKGGFAFVYKADLDCSDIPSLSSMEGKKTVAVKRILSRSDNKGEQGYLAEIELLTGCKHKNIVSLLGYCRKESEMILVYEFAPNGSLGDYLCNPGQLTNLTWVQRIKICLDIASGLKYLHTDMDGKPRIIHRDIKSDNILLDKEMNGKIADFGLSRFQPKNQETGPIQTQYIAGTSVYTDPEFVKTKKYKKESDTYSFGVVLFEILSGTMAYDPIYLDENKNGLAHVARRRFTEGTLKELIDPKLIEEDDDNIFTLNRGPNQDSFDAFSKIAYECLAETQDKRPTIEVIIMELNKALEHQGGALVLTRFRLNDIKSAIKSSANSIGSDASDGIVSKAKLHFVSKSSSQVEKKKNVELEKEPINVAIKHISSREDGQGDQQGFFEEIDVLTRYKHGNIVSLLGFCDQGHEMILVFEDASSGSIIDYLRKNDNKATWAQRLKWCLDIARGLNHLHTKMGGAQGIIHGDIKSANIQIGKNLEAKIAYYGLSKSYQENQMAKETNNSVGPNVHLDPEYEKTGKLSKKSDVFSFGVVLLEVFCGRLADDPKYKEENDKGLSPIARQGFNDGTIKNMIDPKLKEETDEDIFTSNRGPNQDSLNNFSEIAKKCLEETSEKRPTMEVVIQQLKIALYFQENLMTRLQISREDIKSGTHDFSNPVGSGGYWKAYKGVLTLPLAQTNAPVFAKQWDRKFAQGGQQFLNELKILFRYKHQNIIGLVGYRDKDNEKIIVYEHASKGSLDKCLDNIVDLTWTRRLKICIDVASGLEFLHGGAITLEKVVHSNIRSSNILLTGDWRAKISNLELSAVHAYDQDMEHVIKYANGALGYLAPEYKEGSLTSESDIYSFGVVLFDILCGRLAWQEGSEGQSLATLVMNRHEDEGKLNQMVLEGIRKQAVTESLKTFQSIALQSLCDKKDERPKASEVVKQLKNALELQEDHDIWKPKLPINYREIIDMSKDPDQMYSMKKKDLYEKLITEGIFLEEEAVVMSNMKKDPNKKKKLLRGEEPLHEGRVWFSLPRNAKNGSTLISATTFSYGNRGSHKSRSIQKSTARFDTMVKMTDISNLKVKIKLKTKFLALDVVYGVYLVFKFCDRRQFYGKPMYVNLKYQKGNETLHAYFATLRDDVGWMTIELDRFRKQKEDIDFEVFLESFQRCYCGSDTIEVQGIEFRAINNMKEVEKLNGVQQVPELNVDQVQQLTNNVEETSKISVNREELSSWEVDGKKHLIISANKVLSIPHFISKPSDSRFQYVMELPRRQVFRIKYDIDSKMLSPFSEYTCYLVFKLSEKCRGLHCPVKVRDRKNKDAKILYFRTPALWNQNDAISVPKQRKDGWMEVMVWKLSSRRKLGKDNIPLNLKLISYEGTMSGLIVCGLEFRPM